MSRGLKNSSERILDLLRRNPELAARGIARTLGITPKASEKKISNLRVEGRIRRALSDRCGFRNRSGLGA